MKPSIAAAVIIVLGVTSAPSLADELEGEWKLSLPAGYEHVVTIQHMGNDKYYLRKGSLNFSGVYQLKKNKLVMHRPLDERLTEFVWRLKKDGALVLIEEPPTRKTGARYLGATLTKLEMTAPGHEASKAQENPAGETGKPVVIAGNHVLVVIPQNRRAVTAYSYEIGIWARVKLETPLKPEAKPVIAGAMVVFKHGRNVYCYSANSGAWDDLTLTEGSKAEATVRPNCVTLQDANVLYAFCKNAKVWTAVNLTNGDRLRAPPISGKPTSEREPE